MKKISLFLVCAIGLLQGCISTKEVTRDMDVVTGPNYQPVVQKYSTYVPSKVLLLPTTGDVSDDYTTKFTEHFQSYVSQFPNTKIVPWSATAQESSMRELRLSKTDVMKRAQSLGCDAILYISLSDERFNPPWNLRVKLVLEQAATGETLLATVGEYDAGNRVVSNSARRFYQGQMTRGIDPDRSKSVLANTSDFIKFTAYDASFTFHRALGNIITKEDQERLDEQRKQAEKEAKQQAAKNQ
jgi:hypothetical protein